MRTRRAPREAIEEAIASVGRTDPTLAYLNPLELLPTDKILTLKLGNDLTKYSEILRDDQVASTFQQRRLPS